MTELSRIIRADGTVHDPSDCGDCGFDERGHCQRWTETARWHTWIAPSDEQILARMKARRDQAKETKRSDLP